MELIEADEGGVGSKRRDARPRAIDRAERRPGGAGQLRVGKRDRAVIDQDDSAEGCEKVRTR